MIKASANKSPFKHARADLGIAQEMLRTRALVCSSRCFLHACAFDTLALAPLERAFGQGPGAIVYWALMDYVFHLRDGVRRPLTVGAPSLGGLTSDEICLLKLIGARQMEEESYVSALLSWFVMPAAEEDVREVLDLLSDSLSEVDYHMDLGPSLPPCCDVCGGDQAQRHFTLIEGGLQ